MESLKINAIADVKLKEKINEKKIYKYLIIGVSDILIDSVWRK